MTRLLVDFAAEVNMQNEFGNTPLHAGESSLHLFAMPKLSQPFSGASTTL